METTGRITVETAAKWLKMDCQTVRLLIQAEAVPWGICYKLPNSNRFSYLIYEKQFADYTGFGLHKGGAQNGSGNI